MTAPDFPANSLVARCGPSLIGLAAFGVMALIAWLGAPYQSILQWWGIQPGDRLFIDSEAVLLAMDCWRQGADVFVPNACMGGGYYSYSPTLLKAALLPIGPEDTVVVGMAVMAAFLASLCLLPPAQLWGELGLRCAAVLSTAAAFAVERANVDVIVFVITILGLWHLSGRGAARALGYGAFLVAAAVKFYPVTLLGLVVRERFWIAVATAAAALAALGLVLLGSGDKVREAVQLAPAWPPLYDVFGARNLPLLVSQMVGHTESAALRAPLPATGWLTMAVLVAAAAWIASRSAAADARRWPLVPAREAIFMIGGMVIVLGCFIAAQNASYRAIFLLAALPGLVTLVRGGQSRALLIGVMLLLWGDLFRHLERMIAFLAIGGSAGIILDIVFWTLRELLWWAVMARFAALIAVFVWFTDTGTRFRTWARDLMVAR
ncbi:hypothetical protein [Emcibacter sp. SYSU 3D8]|uniref:hypothetical protein n=1 Tax=Emcibacter sp. SYSU 3D8 TaxID=3133969 RepID=UPI0031FF2994